MRVRERGETDLVLCGCAPVRDARWVCDAFLEAVGAECAEHDARGAEEGADCPEGRHCAVLFWLCVGRW